ncbi:MAG: hypothetical protein EOO25_00560 [Comamonadaceae bacterium]|nr:MAG: hypothetical protein EOO25_00560 [Comamonadaceae bacterium]
MHSSNFPRRLCRAACFAPVLAALLSAQAFAAVAPPPLPPGSNLVKIEGGLDRAERKRQVRAHHHKLHHRKDMTRDDSVYGDHEHDDDAGPKGKDKGQEKDKDPKTPKGKK